jgi:hypothetical protein
VSIAGTSDALTPVITDWNVPEAMRRGSREVCIESDERFGSIGPRGRFSIAKAADRGLDCIQLFYRLRILCIDTKQRADKMIGKEIKYVARSI